MYLIPEKKLVTRGNKTFMQTYHVEPGDEVKYKREGIDQKWRTGTALKIDKEIVHIRTKRSSREFKPQVHTVPHTNVITVEQYREKSAKPADPRYTSEGDRSHARHNVSSEELRRRGTIVEERLGFKEDVILRHPSFAGPAIKIVSQLAKENGISTVMTGKPSASLWHQAVDPEYRELLMSYSVAAFKVWRRELSKPLDDQVKKNVREFKEVLAGKRGSSYVHHIMKKEGRAEAIRLLQERRKQRSEIHGQDLNDMTEDPDARRLLEPHSSKPQQLKYALAANGETLRDDLDRILNSLEPYERKAIRLKFGFGTGEAMNNDEVAQKLNSAGTRDGKNRWTRNSVGKLVSGALRKIHDSPAIMEALRFHRAMRKSLQKEQGRRGVISSQEFDRLVTELEALAAGRDAA